VPPRESEDGFILKKLSFSTKKDVFLLKNQPFLRSPFSSKMYKNRVIFVHLSLKVLRKPMNVKVEEHEGWVRGQKHLSLSLSPVFMGLAAI